MIINRFYAFTFLIIVFLAGCKSARVVQPEPPVTVEIPVQESQDELRGLYVSIHSASAIDLGMLGRNMSLVLKNASEANFNMVFIPYWKYIKVVDSTGELTENGFFNPLIEALIKESHQYGLKTSFTIDLMDLLTGNSQKDFKAYLIEKEVSSEIIGTLMQDIQQGVISEVRLDNLLSNQIFPHLKSYLKAEIKRIIEMYNIDGISYDLTDWDPLNDPSPNQPGNNKSSDIQAAVRETSILEIRLKDLLEDVVVETMLVKPYLVNSITYPGNQSHEFILSCLEDKIVDFITPAFDLNDERLVDDLSGLWNLIDDNIDKTREGIFPCLRNINSEDDIPVLEDLMTFNKEMGSQGSCILVNISENANIETFKIPYKFPDHVILPENLKKTSPFEVAELKVSHLLNPEDQDPSIHLFKSTKTKMMDSKGNIALVMAHPDSIDFHIAGRKTVLKTNHWSVPYRYAIYPDSGAVREGVWVEFRRMPSYHTNNTSYHFLGKTKYPATAWIDNDSVKVYKTGIFFNEVNFKEGSNRIRASVLTPDSLSAFYEMEFVYEKDDKIRPAFPLWIDQQSVRPFMDLELLSEDIVIISFQGSPGQLAHVELFPGGDMIKCSRKDFQGYSQYKAEIHLSRLDKDREYQFILNLETEADTVENSIYKFPMENMVTVRDMDDYPVVRINDENTRLTYNLGPIRLGGPIRSELGPGVMMKVNGRMGDHIRVRLNEIESSMVRADQVEVMPMETLAPSYFITNISCGPGFGEDIVSIPYSEPVPYAIHPEPDLNRLVITLYGVKTSSTWISHRKGRKIVDKITWQQSAPDTYKVYVNLKTDKIWGYDLQTDGRQLVLRVKYPPRYEINGDKPLAGLKVAVEAGHGGESTGAVGLSGLLEKDINLDLALKFGALCEKMGAEVFQIRKSDETIGLLDKRRKALASGADLLISIHANAAGTSRGYLRVPGTSTYYNNPFWAPLAESVYDRLLELGLAEFGVVGSFNYTVIRLSQMPSILVEQAFMTHAEDEEKLADPVFRENMATKIYEGIIDYLSLMLDATE
jgi:N-acetylmuramoyl-L-alanine amidase